MIKKIVVIGPESTGKSSLCESLATHFDTFWAPEFARDFLLENGANYDFGTLVDIAKGQIERENQFIEKANKAGKELVFIDTNLYVIQIWEEYVFGKSHTSLLDQIAKRKYDFYLLNNIDLPWQPDPLREQPNEAPRKTIFEIYKNLLIHQNTPWSFVRGLGSHRIENAITAIKEKALSI